MLESATIRFGFAFFLFEMAQSAQPRRVHPPHPIPHGHLDRAICGMYGRERTPLRGAYSRIAAANAGDDDLPIRGRRGGPVSVGDLQGLLGAAAPPLDSLDRNRGVMAGSGLSSGECTLRVGSKAVR